MQLAVAHFFHFFGFQRHTTVRQQIQFLGNSGGGNDIVTGKNLHPHPGAAAGGHSAVHIAAQRVRNGHKAVKDHIAFHSAVGLLCREVLHLRQLLMGKGDHPHGLLLCLHQHPAQFRQTVRLQGAHIQHALRAALYIRENASVHIGNGGHVLELGRERKRAQPGVVLPLPTVGVAGVCLLKEPQHGALRGIADKAAVRRQVCRGVQADIMGQVFVLQLRRLPVPLGIIEGTHGHLVFR